jgi:serine protease AprX
MKKVCTIIVLLVFTPMFSQEDAWVYFKDKPKSQSFLSDPLKMLTQRSLDRRTRQNIPLDIKDVPIDQTYIDQITAAKGITVKAKSKWLNALHIRGAKADIAALTSKPFVQSIEYANRSLNKNWDGVVNYYKPTKKFQDSNQNKIDFNYGNSANQVKMLKADILHQKNFTGSGMVVAVLDGGFPGVNTGAPFKRLRDNNLILGGYDFVNRTDNPYTGVAHGTNVLSDMGGFVDGKLIGTAPDAKYYLFVTEDGSKETPLEESNWVEAVELADYYGVDVINSSLGYFAYDNPAYSHTYSDMTGNKNFASRGANIAHSKGMICIVAAGNDGAKAEKHVATPAEAINAVAVGAVDSNRKIASFSSIGPSFDNRIKPDLMAMGVSSTVAADNGSITTNTGTSFASPILAGAVTSLWSAFPNKTNNEIIQLVKSSSDKFTNPDNNYGYGIPDFSKALNSLATDSFEEETGFKVFPTPTSDLLSISNTKGFTNSSIQVYNSLGQFVLEKKIENPIENISLKSLNSGIYLYNIVSGNKKQSGRIIKE